MAFIEPINRNKSNITYLLHISLSEMFIFFWMIETLKYAKPYNL